MPITRRNLLTGGAALAGAATAAGLGLIGARRLLPRLRRLATPPLPASEPGPLPPRLRQTLLAAVPTLVGPDIDPEPYEQMLDSRATSVRGYRELYRRFAEQADRQARADGAPSFADAEPDLRRRILDDVAPAGRLARLRTGATDPDRARFRLYVTREILDLYAATGAWAALGYGQPPGKVRGLRGYTHAPAGADDGDTP